MSRLTLIGCMLALSLAFAAAAGASTTNFQATFVQIYSTSTCHFPTVFCGSGTIAGYGAASSTSLLTSIGPIPGTDCRSLTAVRTITLDDGSGSLTLAESGTVCPPNANADTGTGDPFTVDKTYTITGGTGIFEGATGSGSDVNRSAGNSQVSIISGAITLA